MSINCPNCGRNLRGPKAGTVEEFSQAASALFGLFTKPSNTISGQRSNCTLLICDNCDLKFSICPFCDAPTRARNSQASTKIKCRNCKEEFIVAV